MAQISFVFCEMAVDYVEHFEQQNVEQSAGKVPLSLDAQS